MSRFTGRIVASGLLVFLGLLVLAWTIPALAGGWAVITLDRLPAQVTAGQPFDVGFIVLQHGNQKTPLTGLTPTVKAVPADGGESLVFSAREDKSVRGHYLATLTLPQAGEWAWSIQAFNMDQPMPVLTVAAGITATRSTVPSWLPAPAWLGTLGLLGFAAGLALTLRRRSVWFAALALGGLGLAALGFGVGIAQTPAQAQDYNAAVAPVPATAQVGHDLFIAKGCVSCHLNNRIETKYVVFSTETGPDLTNHPLGADYLRLWLKDPSAVKPGSKMPALGLSPDEIEALIAFLAAPSE